MGAHTGEVEGKTAEDLRKQHDSLLHLSAFGAAYPEIADMIRSLQRQVSADHERMGILENMLVRQQLALNDHAKVIAELRRRAGNLEAANALYGCDGK